MSRLYADGNGIPAESAKQDKGTMAASKLIEHDRQSRERSERIIDYYRNGEQKGMMI